MAKTITCNIDGNDYVLEYTRASVKTIESKGFNISEITNKPVTTITKLFEGAFIANHRGISNEKIEAIYSKLGDKKKLIERLVDMYQETVTSLIDENEEGNAGWVESN